MNAIGKIAKIGAWELDSGSKKLFWTEEVYRIHEVPPDFVPTLESGIHFYAPESRTAISDAVDRALRFGTAFDLELKIVTATGKAIWVRARGQGLPTEGKIERVFGTFEDISLRRQAEEDLQKDRAQLQAILGTDLDQRPRGKYHSGKPQFLGFGCPTPA